MNLRVLTTLCFCAVMAGTGYAQAIKNCATMEQDSINRILYPRRPTLDDFEFAIQRRTEEIRSRMLAGKTESVVVTIPVIVHVVHNGETIGTGMNISQAQIQSQIAVLNEDYRRMVGTPGFNNSPVGADMEIEFCLSPVDENGIAMTEPGIDRYNGHKSSWAQPDIEGSLKPSTIWNPNLFYNIWTVKFGGASSNLLGYAQFPDQSGLAGLNDSGGPASTDGVVVQFSSFGSVDKGSFPVMQAPYNKGRTLSHETGHWLGLRHIWGDGNCGNDFVSDTPTQQSASSGCQTGRQSCSTTNMVENYMDYSNDACMNIFTIGQKARMQAVMQLSPRRGALLAANLCSPLVADVPTANFLADRTLVLLGGEVNFTDLSTNFPNHWAWIFDGGDPSTSVDRNPRIKYSTPGQYQVTLVATNNLGPSTPLAISNYITVSEEGLCGSVNNFDAGSTPSFIPASNYGSYTGYVTGTNSLHSAAVSEFFDNGLGYEFISGVNIHFGHVHAASEDAAVTVTVWNARGPQHAPGSVIEKKTVLLKQILNDIANGTATTITFDRETPVLNKPFQVGIEFDYSSSDSIAVQSSADGESTNATSWIEDETGVWKQYAIAFGANIALNIEAVIGMNPSVQVSASEQLVYPGAEVILNGKGASIFVWSSLDGIVQNVPGPQLIVHPTVTTTYVTAGSGLTLCNSSANTTIYVRDNVTGLDNDPLAAGIHLYPNPGSSQLTVTIENEQRGEALIDISSVVGSQAMPPVTALKTENKFVKTFDTSSLSPGVYIVVVKLGGRSAVRKWVKW